MSWTHSICGICWRANEPNRDPVRVLEGELALCCLCGRETREGIYIRQDPKGMMCEGKHEEGK